MTTEILFQTIFTEPEIFAWHYRWDNNRNGYHLLSLGLHLYKSTPLAMRTRTTPPPSNPCSNRGTTFSLSRQNRAGQ
jgi:hypothetical protein